MEYTHSHSCRFETSQPQAYYQRLEVLDSWPSDRRFKLSVSLSHLGLPPRLGYQHASCLQRLWLSAAHRQATRHHPQSFSLHRPWRPGS